MISIFMGTATVLVTAGLTTSIIRKEKPENDDYYTVFIFNLVASIIIALILFLIAPLISNFYEQSELKLITRLFCIPETKTSSKTQKGLKNTSNLF